MVGVSTEGDDRHFYRSVGRTADRGGDGVDRRDLWDDDRVRNFESMAGIGEVRQVCISRKIASEALEWSAIIVLRLVSP